MPEANLPPDNVLSVTQVKRSWGKVLRRVQSGEIIWVTRRGIIEARIEPPKPSLIEVLKTPEILNSDE